MVDAGFEEEVLYWVAPAVCACVSPHAVARVCC